MFASTLAFALAAASQDDSTGGWRFEFDSRGYWERPLDGNYSNQVERWNNSEVKFRLDLGTGGSYPATCHWAAEAPFCKNYSEYVDGHIAHFRIEEKLENGPEGRFLHVYVPLDGIDYSLDVFADCNSQTACDYLIQDLRDIRIIAPGG
ncbi:hypothetical protein [Sphingomicrobium arenosum]|uniref:hypothetical protein n=1 Tax=Sphingomicrobium arenosum TaxID=2233861 RepID=UPI00223EB68E|nr:hypothetical protein [Sphingomicrobium arenosum]